MPLLAKDLLVGERYLYEGRDVDVVSVGTDVVCLRFVNSQETVSVCAGFRSSELGVKLEEYCCEPAKLSGFTLLDWTMSETTNPMIVEGSCISCKQRWRSTIPSSSTPNGHVRYFKIEDRGGMRTGFLS